MVWFLLEQSRLTEPQREQTEGKVIKLGITLHEAEARFRSLFAENLKANRVFLGLSQTELAVRCGVSQQTISAYERGTVSPPAFMLAILARELRCKVQELADYTVS